MSDRWKGKYCLKKMQLLLELDRKYAETEREAIQLARQELVTFHTVLRSLEQLLQGLLDAVDRHAIGVGTSQVAGGTAGVVGGLAVIASVLLIPATLGASAVVGIGGAVVGAAGAATSIGASIGDHIQSGNFKEELQNHGKEIQKAFNKMLEAQATALQVMMFRYEIQPDTNIQVYADMVGIGLHIFPQTPVVFGLTAGTCRMLSGFCRTAAHSAKTLAPAAETAEVFMQGANFFAQSAKSAVPVARAMTSALQIAGGVVGVVLGVFDVVSGIATLYGGHASREGVYLLMGKVRKQMKNVQREHEEPRWAQLEKMVNRRLASPYEIYLEGANGNHHFHIPNGKQVAYTMNQDNLTETLEVTIDASDIGTGNRTARLAASQYVRTTGNGWIDDEAGHILAAILGGPMDETANLFAQDSTSNKYQFHHFEKPVRDHLLQHGGRAKLRFEFNFDDDGRPDHIRCIAKFTKGPMKDRGIDLVFPNQLE